MIAEKPILKTGEKCKSGITISVKIPEPEETHLEPDFSKKLSVVYEDESLLVLDKPAGVVVHPGAGNKKGTLVNLLVAHLGKKLLKIGDALRPGIVHRLDKNTSGLMVVAKTAAAYYDLQRQFKPPRTISRTYLAVAKSRPKVGTPKKGNEQGTINLPIGRHPVDRKKMAVTKSGKEAVTHWEVVEELEGAVVLRLTLETGRTHQIRVHLAAEGAHILGDEVYGAPLKGLSLKAQKAAKDFNRQALHAAEISFIHPMTKKIVSYKSPLPKDIKELIRRLRA